MKEPYIVITFYLKDLKVLQESICKLNIDYSSSVKLGYCLAEHSKTKQHVIEIKMEKHNVKLKIPGECSQRESNRQLGPGRKLRCVASFPTLCTM